MSSPSWAVARIDEVATHVLPSGARRVAIREHLDVQAFGINAYSGDAGQTVIDEHDEAQALAAGHQELYVVLAGRATFAVAVRLVVLVDDDVARLPRRIGVRTEGGDPEAPPHRMPVEPVTRPRPGDLLERRDLPAASHRDRSSSSTTGSIDSAPSTRSSRFSFPAQRANASASSPS